MASNRRRRSATPAATLLGLAALLGVGFHALPARADQDDDAERVPSNAGDVYSPIERTFQRQQLLPGGPVARLPQFGPSVPKSEGPVLLEDLKERLRNDDPFFRDMNVSLYLRTGTSTARTPRPPPRRRGPAAPRSASARAISTAGCSSRPPSHQRSRCMHPRTRAARCCSPSSRRR
jgi:hypothetical protein